MSFVRDDSITPEELARAATTAGRYHDVVVSASRFVNDQPLDARNTSDLKWARDRLKEARSKDVVLAMPASVELSGAGAVVALRKAAPTDGDDVNLLLQSLEKGVGKALKGERTVETIDSVNSLRQLFSRVSRICLQTEIQQDVTPVDNSWAISTANLNS